MRDQTLASLARTWAGSRMNYGPVYVRSLTFALEKFRDFRWTSAGAVPPHLSGSCLTNSGRRRLEDLSTKIKITLNYKTAKHGQSPALHPHMYYDTECMSAIAMHLGDSSPG